MNNKLILLILTLTLLGCATFKQNKATDFTLEHKTVAQNGMNIPILTNEKDKAPSLDYIRKKIEQEAFLPINGKQPEFVDSAVLGRPVISSFTEIINDTLTLVFHVKDIHGDYVSDIREYIKESKNHRDILGQDFYFRYSTWRKYYPNGQLKSYEVYVDHPHSRDTRIGTWCRFDDEGNLLLTIDHEKYFKTPYLEVLKKAFSYNRRAFEIRRVINADKSYWYIHVHPIDFEPKPHIHIIIDGETGKVIEEYEASQSKDFPERLKSYFDDEYSKKLYKQFFR